MTLLIISFIAGVLTVLAPCILPLLPVIIGSSVGARSKATPYIVIGSLALSILLFTYLLKVSTAFIGIPLHVWSYISGGILAIFGLVLLFPQIWEALPFVSKTNVEANKLLGAGHQKKSFWGDVLIGASLGPIFSSCSPTYFVILGAVLPASFLLGTTYLLAYIFGLVLVLILIALLGQRLTAKLEFAADSRSWFKRGLGALFIIVGITIMFGVDKKIQTWMLNSNYFNITKFEQKILDTVNVEENLNSEENNSHTPEQTSDNSKTLNTTTSKNINLKIPKQLEKLFPKTDWSKADSNIENAISGGPTKDGIPALENPKFIPINEFPHDDTIQTIVLKSDNEIKVYPYNILTWHEIVNDTIDNTPVAVTFCPLCGSAIVFDRTLPDGTISTFGVSGSLLESNMIMYDRNTENLWQQSTGKVLAGSFYPNKLELVPFQFLTIGEVKELYPEAMVLSDKTGHIRNYARNPYAGYETNNSFVNPSNLDTSFPPKEIMAIFTTKDDVPVATPWLKLRETNTANITINNSAYFLTVSDNGELSIVDTSGDTYPFYFEMWFSFAVQHGDKAEIIKL